ncbi:imidazole glycerol phosphate synthase subunit HisF [candidate division KSB1 bacterium]|nr:imidazole glycerol phosphate synthase subunit HisF [candidate division KSB1 bacterium]
MFRPRVIPTLLLKKNGLVKTIRFRKFRYIGDPINAVKIFNEKLADELVFLDITASRENRTISAELVEKIGDEAYMPFTVGGGIRTIDDIRKIINSGAEKVAINTQAVIEPQFIQKAADVFGSSTIVVSIDVKKVFPKDYRIYTHSGSKKTTLDPREFAIQMEKMGAGEIFLNSVDRDGTMAGYDLDLIKYVSNAVSVPVIACGGAGSLNDFPKAVFQGGASAVAAGSLFVYHGRLNAVLINFPKRQQLEDIFSPAD